jgi:hypothetical protein
VVTNSRCSLRMRSPDVVASTVRRESPALPVWE